jgi:hypothetical protein
MNIIYNIYSNNGSGGPVDYSAPVASTSELSCELGPLAAPGDYTFAVRACDVTTGLEEANTDARVRVVIDTTGRDVSGIPGAPHALELSPSAGGGCRVCWAYSPSPDLGTPDEFLVFVTPAGSVSGSAPAASVAYVPGRVGYSCQLLGPFELGTYTASVRSSNASGLDPAALTVTAVIGQASQPLLMDPVTVRMGSAGPA